MVNSIEVSGFTGFLSEEHLEELINEHTASRINVSSKDIYMTRSFGIEDPSLIVGFLSLLISTSILALRIKDKKSENKKKKCIKAIDNFLNNKGIQIYKLTNESMACIKEFASFRKCLISIMDQNNTLIEKIMIYEENDTLYIKYLRLY